MHKNQSILFTIVLIVFVILTGLFGLFYKGAVGSGCMNHNFESFTQLICVMKHTVYGSLTISFFVSIFLREFKNKH